MQAYETDNNGFIGEAEADYWNYFTAIGYDFSYKTWDSYFTETTFGIFDEQRVARCVHAWKAQSTTRTI